MNAASTGPRSLHRIAIVDDHSIIRAVFRSLAEDDESLNMIWTATCLEEAKKELENAAPDILILDVSLPDGVGYDLLPMIQKNHPRTKVMMVSSHEEREYAQRAQSMGARGYLTKNASTHDLTQAIHLILANKTYFKPEVVLSKPNAALPGN